MSVEAVRLVADWLTHATEGVNPVLVLVPRFSGDAAPTPLAGIYDRARHGWVARGRVPRSGDNPPTLPLALVMPGEITQDPSIKTSAEGTKTIAGTLEVIVQVVIEDSDTDDGVTDLSYYLRAIRGSLLNFATAARASSRTANGVQLVQMTKLAAHEPPAPAEDKRLTGAVAATFTTRETVPVA
jgi:hypothetical protein